MAVSVAASPGSDITPEVLQRRATDHAGLPKLLSDAGSNTDINSRLARRASSPVTKPQIAVVKKRLPWLLQPPNVVQIEPQQVTLPSQHNPPLSNNVAMGDTIQTLTAKSNSPSAQQGHHSTALSSGESSHHANVEVESHGLVHPLNLDCASSEYSATASGHQDPLPASLPEKVPVSHDDPYVNELEPREHCPSTLKVVHQWLQSELDLPLDNSEHTKLPQTVEQNRAMQPKRNPVNAELHQPSSVENRNKSCDAAVQIPRTLGVCALPRPTTIRSAPSNHNSIDSELPSSPQELTRACDAEHRDFSSEGTSSQASNAPKKHKPHLQKGITQPTIRLRQHERPAFATHHQAISSSENSISHTPPRLYQAVSAESIVRDFAYRRRVKNRQKSDQFVSRRDDYGAAADYYGDQGESVAFQPGARKSLTIHGKQLPMAPIPLLGHNDSVLRRHERVHRAHAHRHANRIAAGDKRTFLTQATQVRPSAYRTSTLPAPTPQVAVPLRNLAGIGNGKPLQEAEPRELAQSSQFLQVGHRPNDADLERDRSVGGITDASTQPQAPLSTNFSLRHPRKTHVSLRDGEGFSLGRYHKRQPIAREWNQKRKRLTAMIACLNTIFIGLIAGIYAGEVPRIQYQLADSSHWVIFGNTLFFAGIAISTILFWPLPLLHGRRPYTLLAFGLLLPLHIPQAITVTAYHRPGTLFRTGLLLPRALTGFALGFANINILPTLLDLFGASLQSEHPHQEIVAYDDVRRQGGGIGVWLGIWTFCFSSSLAIGFCAGALIIYKLNPSWGFWLIIVLLAFFLLLNVTAPETRKSAYRRSVHHFYDAEDPENIKRRVARGEVSLHIWNDGPKYWFQEVWAGIVLTKRMILQPGFFVLMVYLAWINAQLTFIILLLGALLSRDYQWPSYSVGLAALAVPVGAALAMPLTKASWFSRARSMPPRTDSMTMKPKRLTYSSHLLRRIIFSSVLPFAGLGYSLSASGPPLHWSACIIFAGFAGFLTDLGTAECIGLIMETFDTSDLQPGVNTKHRLQSLSANNKRRRTNYSSFPRVCAGFFAAQSLGFLLAAGATIVSGRVTDAYGAQTAISIVAGILLGVTLLFFLIVWRWKEVQVIPNYTLDTRKGSRSWDPSPSSDDPDWKPVVIGNPSGKMRRMNLLELGRWSRWSEIRRLNKLE